MTAGELVRHLTARCDPEDRVVLASDSEGNDYRYLDDLAAGFFDPQDRVVYESKADAIDGMGTVGVPVIIFWPED